MKFFGAAKVGVSRKVDDLNECFRFSRDDRFPKRMQGQPFQTMISQIIDGMIEVEAIDVECRPQIRYLQNRKTHEPESVGPHGMP